MDFVLRYKLLLRVLKLYFLRGNRNIFQCNELCTRSALFWLITQREVVVSYRRFGTTYRYHFQGARFLDLGMIGCPETSMKVITTDCVITQKSAVLIEFAAVA